jgi:6,7-dimethyl-8-ribityllumazine synthase
LGRWLLPVGAVHLNRPRATLAFDPPCMTSHKASFLPRPRSLARVPQHSFAVVASKFNAQYVDALVESARHELEALEPESAITIYEVPGAFEIPLVVQEVASAGKVDAIIALGVIIQGETQHAQLIGRAVTDALQQAALKHRIPVIHEVLLVEDDAQAAARCGEGDLNRGVQAARAAVQMVQLIAYLNR